MADRVDPYMQSGFRVEIDSIIRTEFIECTFTDTSTEPPTARKLSGLSEYGNITLKWVNHGFSGALRMEKAGHRHRSIINDRPNTHSNRI